MTIRQLMEIVWRRRLDIVIQDGRLVIKKQKGSDGMTDELMAVIHRKREKIMEYLRHAK